MKVCKNITIESQQEEEISRLVRELIDEGLDNVSFSSIIRYCVENSIAACASAHFEIARLMKRGDL